jgi:chemosensory pili system protein ChpA (sensor histidine kinase/response regulator)
MRFQDDIDFTTLNWVKSELDATLQHARVALEAYAEDPQQAVQIRSCANDLHLVHGSLRMVELYGAAMVVEEMERVAEGLCSGAIAAREDVLSVLMRGIVQLPDYLERLQSGHKDIPIILLPLLNDLRAARSEKLLSESVLFTPNLAAPLPAPKGTPLPDVQLRVEARRLRNIYDATLLRWIRNDERSALRLAEVLDRLYAICSHEDTRRLWWIANGVLDGVRSQTIEASVAIKVLFGKIDREIKRLIDEGETAFSAAMPRDLSKNLLYYLAHADVDTPRATEIRQLYRLDSLLPSAQELAHAHGSISGHNRALLDTVAAAIKDDLLHVKEALDIFLRGQGGRLAETDEQRAQMQSYSELEAQTDVLDRVADTLGMLGLGVPRRLVSEQREIIADIVHGQRRADEATLLDVAGALLHVEASLDDHIERLGLGNTAEPVPSSGVELPRGEIGRILDALMREAGANIAQAKTDIVAFVEAPWDHVRVDQVPRLLVEVAGALDMLSLRDAAELVSAFVHFVNIELLQHRRVPNHEQMDTIADALASIDYYLEATREQRSGRERILDITRESLSTLNYWPLPSLAAPIPEPAPLTGEQLGDNLLVAADDLQIPHAEIDATVPLAFEFEAASIETEAALLPEISSAPAHVRVTEALLADPAAAAASPPQNAAPQAPASDGALTSTAARGLPDPDAVNHGIDFGFGDDAAQMVDGEIREIFLEEVEEEIAKLQTELPLWRSEPEDMERLRTIRRSFHTLKGSGRLVGAQALGDYAWKVENMLNRVLDKTIGPSQPVQLLVGHSIDALPDLLAALRDGTRPAVDIVAIKAVAEQLAAGTDAWVNEATLRPRKPVPGEVAVAEATSPVEHEAVVPAATETIAAEPALMTSAGERSFDSGMTELPQLDPLLFEVLQTEVGVHLAAIDGFVTEAHTVSPLQATPALLRAVHTLNGAIAMVELPQISEVLRPLEDYVKRLHAWQQAIDADGADVLAETSAHIKIAIAALGQTSARLPDFSQLAQRVVELRDALPDVEFLQSLLTTAEGEADNGLFDNEHEEDSALESHAFRADHSGEGSTQVPGEAHPEELAAPEYARHTQIEDTVGHDAHGDVDAARAALNDARSEIEDAARDFGTRVPETTANAHPTEEIAAVDASSAAPELSDAELAQAALVALDDARATELPDRIESATSREEALAPNVTQTRLADESNEAARVQDAEIAATEHAQPVVHAEESTAESGFETTALAPAAEDLFVPEEFLARDLAPIETQPVEPAAVESPTLDAEALETSASALAGSAATPVEAAPVEEIVVASSEPDASYFDHAEAATRAAGYETVEPQAPASAPPPPTESAEPVVIEAEPVREEIHESVVAFDAFPAALAPVPPAFPIVDIDDDLLDIFISEATEILDHSDGLMARLREASNDRELVNGLQRDLHTLKGGAHTSGFAAIGDLSHAMESLLEAANEQQLELDTRAIRALESSFDHLHAMVQQATQRQASPIPYGQIRDLEELVRRLPLPADAVEPPALETTPSESAAVAPEPSEFDDKTINTVAESIEPVATPATVAPPAPEVEAEPAAARIAAERAPERAAQVAPPVQERVAQEQVRIRADLLDALVNHAGEVSIYRSRLEQQVAGYRFNLIEFEATVTRLREQLRKLELETEAQILSRYQRADDAGLSAFDPLELDRFSQLQQLSRSLSESVSDLSSIQGTFDELTRTSETLLVQQARVNSDLQEGLMRTRMVPFESLVPALRRTLRQGADDVGKRAQLKVEGAQGEMDRNLLERMKAPFEHMLRNALAHGIETPEERVHANKPPEGQVTIAVSREATEVVLRVSDDGRGLDREAIRQRAIERGLLKPDAQLGDQDLYAYILDSGFSTAENITQISGRGVGMDVVNNEIKLLGGSLAINSVPGKGATFNVRLPFTLAVTQAIVVRIGESTFAIPITAVQGVVRIGREDLDQRLAAADPTYSYRGEPYPIHELSQLLNVTSSRLVDDLQVPLLITRSGDQRGAIRVDAVLGSREIVVKSVGPQISSVPGIFGATIMGDGSVVMIIDLAPFVRRAALRRAQEAASGVAALPPPPPPAAPKRPLIMVVDDSITMRKATSRVLERQEMEVMTAKDGLDAVEKLQDRIPNLVVLDIEMPRMDGYEFAVYMKNDVRTREIPIIMVTSRTGEKHRLRALEIGVERYLGKPYQEADLMQNIREALEQSRVAGANANAGNA